MCELDGLCVDVVVVLLGYDLEFLPVAGLIFLVIVVVGLVITFVGLFFLAGVLAVEFRQGGQFAFPFLE